MQGQGEDVNMDTVMSVLKPDDKVEGGLYVPEKHIFRPPERKSSLGLDVLAISKRDSEKRAFKVPSGNSMLAVALADDRENENPSLEEDEEISTGQGVRSHSLRSYRGSRSKTDPSLSVESSYGIIMELKLPRSKKHA